MATGIYERKLYDRVCTICGVGIHNVYQNTRFCTECRKKLVRERVKQWQIDNPEKYSELLKRMGEKSKIWRKEYPEEARKLDRLNRLKPGYGKRHRLASQKWIENNKDKRRKSQLRSENKRRLRKSKLFEIFSESEWIEKIKSTNGICYMCKKNVGINNLTKDHIFPISKAPVGYEYTINDVQPLCRSCNSSKRDKYGME